MTIRFDGFKDMFDHLQEVCSAFNHVLEIKSKVEESVMPSEGELEAHSKRMGELKKKEGEQ